jgi:hypothetical protein
VSWLFVATWITVHGPHSLPVKEMVEIGGIFFYMLHDLNQLDLEPSSAAGIHVVVSGHTHQPQIGRKKWGYLSQSGKRRPSAVRLSGIRRHRVRIENGTVIPRIIEIDL